MCRLSSHLLRKSIQRLQSLQSRNGSSIFNPITKERRQDLNLLPRQEPRRQRLDNRSEEGHSLAAQDWVFVIDIFSELLDNLDQSGLLAFDIWISNR